MIASCSALMLENPVPAAAALIPPNSRTSVEVLRPKQLAVPGVPANGANTQAAPSVLLSKGPPTMAVLPSPESATEEPCPALPTTPVPTSFCCWLHTPLGRVNTHAAPIELPDKDPKGPPMMAVFPSPESETERPCCPASGNAPLPTSLGPCWLHTPPERVNIHAAPIA